MVEIMRRELGLIGFLCMSEENTPGFQQSPPTPPLGSRIRLGLMGAGVAAYSAMCGIGGGLFMTPILHYVRKLPLKNAVATSLALVAASASSATVAELIHEDGRLTPERSLLVLFLVIGSLIGAQVGFRVAKRVDVTFLKLIFGLVLLVFRLLRMLQEQSFYPVWTVRFASVNSPLRQQTMPLSKIVHSACQG